MPAYTICLIYCVMIVKSYSYHNSYVIVFLFCSLADVPVRVNIGGKFILYDELWIEVSQNFLFLKWVPRLNEKVVKHCTRPYCTNSLFIVVIAKTNNEKLFLIVYT